AGENAVDSVIPVAWLSDMLLHPGETYEFDGQQRKAFSGPRLPAGENAVDSVIPVAWLSDMLLHPGETYEFDGQQR
ncbi:hypothetical protein CKQ90_35340, partial [Klebsiella pneumoniae]